MFAEAWRQKVEQGADMASISTVASGRQQDAIVVVGVRRDGSVDAVTFERSSGSAELDAAIRRQIMALAPYPRFPPELAADYDVVVIRRIFTVGAAIRLFPAGPP